MTLDSGKYLNEDVLGVLDGDGADLEHRETRLSNRSDNGMNSIQIGKRQDRDTQGRQTER